MSDYCKSCYKEHLGVEGDDFAHLTTTPGNWGVLCEGCGYVMIITRPKDIQFAYEVRHVDGRCLYWTRNEWMAEIRWEHLWDEWYESTEFGHRGKCPYSVEQVEIYGPQPLVTKMVSI